MTGWVHQWLVAVRTRLRQRCDLVLEVIVLRHQLAVLQRTGTRRPCFRPSDRLLWVLLSRWWPNWQRKFPMGRAADSWRAAEAWIQCLASHSVPLHATAGIST